MLPDVFMLILAWEKASHQIWSLFNKIICHACAPNQTCSHFRERSLEEKKIEKIVTSLIISTSTPSNGFSSGRRSIKRRKKTHAGVAPSSVPLRGDDSKKKYASPFFPGVVKKKKRETGTRENVVGDSSSYSDSASGFWRVLVLRLFLGGPDERDCRLWIIRNSFGSMRALKFC